MRAGTALHRCNLAINFRFHFVNDCCNEALVSAKLQQLSHHDHHTDIEDLIILGFHMIALNQVRNLESCSCLGKHQAPERNGQHLTDLVGIDLSCLLINILIESRFSGEHV